MDIKAESLEKHALWRGKIKVVPNVRVSNPAELALAYTPGVAQPCLEIQKDESLSYSLTRRWNTIAVVTDGSAVLGLGDIGAVAGMPVMEGKCLLFSEMGGIDAIPICINSRDPDEIVRTVELIQGSFGGINLEDISAPRCFEIESRLRKSCSIPVFHDDQHGTAIVCAAALMNALKVTCKKASDIKLVICGSGAAGSAIGALLGKFGIKNIVYVDKIGALSRTRNDITDAHMRMLANTTNPNCECGGLIDVIKGADAFIGVSAPGILSGDAVKTMAENPIIFAMANPVPEIMPDVALSAGAAIVGTGRSDFPNQINNLLAFPGVFRGALDCRASDITDSMKLAAAKALAGFIPENELSQTNIIPSPFNREVTQVIAEAVARAAKADGVARI